jgi:IclR family transcriptional regulator, mhp operon transcriptional activator
MRTSAQASNRRKSRGVTRTLDILRALNEANGSTVSTLHAITRVSRPALYRTLEEFQAAGYVNRDGRGRFHLTHLVRTLSDGFRDEDRIAEAAAPILSALQRRVLWPTDLATYANHSMELRETTRRQSPLVIDSARVGLRLPMLASAEGLAYLAFCDDKEREEIVEALRRSDRPGDELAKDERWVRQLVRQARAAGYASRYMGAIPGLSSTATGTIALPLRDQDRVRASIGITFFSKVLTIAEAASRHLADLRDACVEVEKRLGARPHV